MKKIKLTTKHDRIELEAFGFKVVQTRSGTKIQTKIPICRAIFNAFGNKVITRLKSAKTYGQSFAEIEALAKASPSLESFIESL